jgi:hypothetical protein
MAFDFGFCSGYLGGMSALAELRKTLETRYAATLPVSYRTAQVVGTGVRELDALLPAGGLPRGRLVAWAPGGGATAVLRSACAAAVARGERAAWVDVAATLTADYWSGGVLLVRPAGEPEGLESAELLLQSGGFAVVVVSGAGERSAREGVRLTRAARAGGSALVLVTAAAPVAQLRIRSRLPPDAYEWWRDPFGEPVAVRSVQVEIEAGSLGWSGRTSFRLPVLERTPRASPESALADRRGVRRRWRSGQRPGAARDAAGGVVDRSTRTLAHPDPHPGVRAAAGQ